MSAALLKQLLSSLKKGGRKRFNIGLASSYLASVEAVVNSDGAAAEDYLGLGGLSAFKRAAKEAARRPVYIAQDMRPSGSATLRKGKVVSTKGLSPRAEKLLAKQTDGTPAAKACMKFEAIITSTRKDRDGDILESKGARIDDMMPLLWQHNACQPIGRHLGVVGRNDEKIKSLIAIADTPLGHDAAALVEFDALRISHGFNPISFEPLDDDDRRGFAGWHVKEFEICEVSLVSIPSNVDAVITAYSRQKLSTPLMKGWAKGVYERRKKSVKGGYDKNGKNGPSQKAVGQGTVVINMNTTSLLEDIQDTLKKNVKKSVEQQAKILLERLAVKRCSKDEDEEDESGKAANVDQDGAPTGDEEEEEDEEESEEPDAQEEGEETLLETIRGQLQEMMDSGELPDERVSQVYDMILRVSEAIGAQKAEMGALDEETTSGDDGKMDYDEGDMSMAGGGKDDLVDDYREDDEEDGYSRNDDEEEEEEDGKDEPSKTVGVNQPGWEGDDTDDENTGTNGPPKSHAATADAAEYLVLSLTAGNELPPAVRKRLAAALGD